MAPPKKSVTPSLPISLKVPRYTENIFIQRFFFWFLGFLLSLGVWYIGARLVVWHGAWLSPETTQKIVSWLDIPGEKVAPLRTTEGVVLEDVLVKPLPDRAVWDISFTLLNRNNFPVYTPQLSFRLQGAQSVASIAPLPGEPIVGAGSSRNVHIQLPRTQALGERGIPYEMTLVHPNTGNGVGLSDKVKPGE